MNIKSLQLKRALRTALLVLMLSAMGMGKGYAYDYDFSAKCSSGQTLYYQILNSNEVAVTYPYHVESPYPVINDYWYNFDRPTGNLSIPESVTNSGISYSVTQIREHAFSNCNGLTGVVIPNSVHRINEAGFGGCTGLTKITIPNSITYIGVKAFYSCNSLSRVNITDLESWCRIYFAASSSYGTSDNLYDYRYTNPLFYAHKLYLNGSLVQDLTIPDGIYSINSGAFIGANIRTLNTPTSVTSIGIQSFDGCSNLESINISNFLTSIGQGAFHNCSSLSSITIPESVRRIAAQAFSGCSNLTIVNYNASNCEFYNSTYYGQVHSIFKDCNSLTTLNIGNAVQSFSNWLYADCPSITKIQISDIAAWCGIAFEGTPFSSGITPYLNDAILTDLEIPEGVSSISPYAFKDAACIRCVSLPHSLTVIGRSAFEGCSSLSGGLNIPQSVTTIENSAFANCEGISEVYYSGNMTQWCNITFDNMTSNPLYYAHNLYINNDLITNLTIPESITEIKDYAFYGGNCFAKLTIPKSVTSIGSYAFDNCNGLTMVDFYATNCTSISSFNSSPIVTVNIGENVQTIPSNAFSNCASLNTIISLATTPPTIGSNAFSNISPVATLFVPCGSQMAYFSNWNMFEYNNIHEDCTSRPVSISSNITGGTVTPSVSQATMGQEVRLTVTPNPGMTLSSLTVYNTVDPTQIIPITPIGKTTSVYSFVMPPYAVSVSASFNYTSVDENDCVSASIHPNPTSSIITIKAESLKQIYIYNMLGQIIYEREAFGNELDYDFSKQGEGIYFIRIETSNGVVTKRVVVTR